MVVLSFVLTLTIIVNIDLGITRGEQMESIFIKETTLDLQAFRDKLNDPKLVGYIQFTYNTVNCNLNISSLFIKETERGKGYGIFLMIFYLCAFLKNVHNSYYIKNLSLDDDSNLTGTKKSIYYIFGFRTTEEPTMTNPFLISRPKQNKRARNEDPSFFHLNNIIDYYNSLLDKFNHKLSFINDNFCFELSSIEGDHITTNQLSMSDCMVKAEKPGPVTRSRTKQKT